VTFAAISFLVEPFIPSLHKPFAVICRYLTEIFLPCFTEKVRQEPSQFLRSFNLCSNAGSSRSHRGIGSKYRFNAGEEEKAGY
jgi:hypothetical protein